MDSSLLLSGDDFPSSSSSSYAPRSASTSTYLTSVTPATLRALSFSDSFSDRLLHSPKSSLLQPRALVDWLFSIALNLAINYGVGYLEWRLAFASSPVPIINPWAEENGRWSRGSLLVDLIGTSLITIFLMTLLQGTLLQLEVGRALRRPIHPAAIGRPFSYLPALTEPRTLHRIGRLELQVGLPAVCVAWLLTLLLCAGLREGLSCAVDSGTAIWLKLTWVAGFVTLYYPLLVVASINLHTLGDQRTQQYIDKVREKERREQSIQDL